MRDAIPLEEGASQFRMVWIGHKDPDRHGASPLSPCGPSPASACRAGTPSCVDAEASGTLRKDQRESTRGFRQQLSTLQNRGNLVWREVKKDLDKDDKVEGFGQRRLMKI